MTRCRTHTSEMTEPISPDDASGSLPSRYCLMSLLLIETERATWARQRRHFTLPLVLLVCLLPMFGCDDPSNVGQGLLDAQAGETRIIPLSPGEVSAGDRSDLTGGNSASGAVRALVGVVDDPVIGTMRSTGFVDFVPSSQFGSDFLNGSVSWAGLELNLDYRYGDTTGVLQFDLYGVAESWLSSEITADADIPLGSLVASYEVPVREGIVSLPLPEAWVAANDARLRSETFTDAFHGFSIVPTAGNAIAGFRFTESALRATVVPGDTVSFALSKVGTVTEVDADRLPSDYVILQDGAPHGVFLRFPLRGDGLEESLIHRVTLGLTAENLDALYPDSFLRPLPSVLGMEAVSADGLTRLEIAEVSINADGRFIMDNTTLTNVFQSANLGKSVLDRFELYFPAEQSGVGFFAFPLDSGSSIEALITATTIN